MGALACRRMKRTTLSKTAFSTVGRVRVRSSSSPTKRKEIDREGRIEELQTEYSISQKTVRYTGQSVDEHTHTVSS